MAAKRTPGPRELVLDENRSKNWREFKIAWANLEIQLDHKSKSIKDKERVENLLKYIGEEAVEVYESFEWENESDKLILAKVMAKFEKYCNSKGSSKRTQQHSECEDEFEGNVEQAGRSEEVKRPTSERAMGMIGELNADLSIFGISIHSKEDFVRLKEIVPVKTDYSPHKQLEIPQKVSLLCWNINGMDVLGKVGKRTEAVVDLLKSENHDIVLLQEVTAITFNYMVQKLSDSYIFARQENKTYYFTATLLKKETVRYKSHKTILFRNSDQGRSILLTKASVGSANLTIINVHLESSGNKNVSQYRRAQLQKCLDIASSSPQEQNVIVAGDLNIRDWEIEKINFPKRILDLWVQNGSMSETKYTFDLSINKNNELSQICTPKMRLDRILFRGFSAPETLTSEYFGLTGKTKVDGLELFPSDHWAVVVKFALLPDAQQPLPTMESGMPTDVSRMGSNSDEEELKDRPQEFVKDNWDDEDED